MSAPVTPAEIENAIRNVPDFPKPGIQFKDITPVLADARLFSGAIDLLTEKFSPGGIDGLHEVSLVIENAETGKEIYELRTMLFEAPDDATAGDNGGQKAGKAGTKRRSRS